MVLASGGFYLNFYEAIFNVIGTHNPYYDITGPPFIVYKETYRKNNYIGMLFSFGCAIGVILSAILVDKIGRIKTMIYNEGVVLLTFVMYLIASEPVFWVNQFITGLTSGI